MSEAQILLLGAIAGFTIFLGLPLGRVESVSGRFRAALSALAAGILIFLLWDVLVHGVAPVEESLEHAVAEGASWARFAGLAFLLAAGLVFGYMSLVYYAAWMKNRSARPPVGPGAAAVAEYEDRSWFMRLGRGHQLALLIATGIGLHNFGEGLAIGQAGAAGELSLALALIIGFGLHNATEGFGIVGPISGDGVRPSWGFLALLGVIGGGPTFLGTVVGQAWVSEALTVVFMAVAAGSILYVVQELIGVNRSSGYPVLCAWMLLLGLALGFGTDFVLEATELIA
jgi:zinc transporter, ZIP family